MSEQEGLVVGISPAKLRALANWAEGLADALAITHQDPERRWRATAHARECVREMRALADNLEVNAPSARSEQPGDETDALRALADEWDRRADEQGIRFGKERDEAEAITYGAISCAWLTAAEELRELLDQLGQRPGSSGDGVAKQRKQNEQLVVRQIDARTWSVQKKAVPGFRLSRSTMAAGKPRTGGEQRG